ERQAGRRPRGDRHRGAAVRPVRPAQRADAEDRHRAVLVLVGRTDQDQQLGARHPGPDVGVRPRRGPGGREGHLDQPDNLPRGTGARSPHLKGRPVSRRVFRLLTVAAAATAAVGLTALPALAHVTVSSPGATQGSFGVLTFRMPNEMDNANATELKVQLPADQPLASVSVKPEPGWA